jgi:ABC-type transporter Mla subunit MlaD
MTRRGHWKLGLFVLLGLGALVGMTLWLTERRLRRPSATYVSFFEESVHGLSLGAPVKFKGSLIGRVVATEIAPDHRHVQVTSAIWLSKLRDLAIRPGTWPPDLVATLDLASITADRFLQIDVLAPDQTVVSLGFATPPNTIPVVPSSLERIERGAVAAAEAGAQLGGLVNQLRRDADLAAQVLDDVGPLARDLRALVHDGRATSRAFADLARGLDDPHGPLQELLARARGAASDLVATSTAVRGVAGTFGDRALLLGDDVELTLSDLRSSLEAVRALARLLERDPAALVRGRSQQRGRP